MKILVAMSGGVDSSVAAALLLSMGHECVGCTMRLYDNEDAGLSREGACCTLEDCEDARAVAYKLGMRYFVLNFTAPFREKVMIPFAESYRRAETPNPCVECNRALKFDALRRRAELLGCDAVATGHYARIGFSNGRYVLKKALDETKDQSYMLYTMSQDELAHTLFPLGELEKSRVRRIAEGYGLRNARKPDSQDICFVPDGDCAGAVERILNSPNRPGRFVTPEGDVLGQHRGIEHFTLGQRRGFELSLPQKRYVSAIDPESGDVTLAGEEALYSTSALVRDVNWISGETPEASFRCTARTRYRAPDSPALATPLGGGMLRLEFDRPQRAITPGQAAVLYDGDTVLGGGTITKHSGG